MVKILITGFTRGQCSSQYLESRLQIVPSHYSLAKCLLAMGHEVHHRNVILGEDISEYDEVIVYLADPQSRSSIHVYEGLYAISQHPKCILAVDDWPVSKTFKGISSTATGDKVFGNFLLQTSKLYKAMEQVQPYRRAFEKAFQVIKAMRNRLLVCVYSSTHLKDLENYGAHLLTKEVSYPRDRIFTYNPNPYNRNRTWEDLDDPQSSSSRRSAETATQQPAPRPTKKERHFNFASLVQPETKRWLRKQQGLVGDPDTDEPLFIGEWPVDRYGSQKFSKTRLTEGEMVRVFIRDWGCLLPSYKHAGSGWWRAKPLQCADAGSILVGDERDLRVYYGDDYPFYGLTAEDISQRSDDELEGIAAAQKECLYRLHPLDKRVQRREVKKVLDAAK